MRICTHAKSLQSYLTLCERMDCTPSGSSVREILQARILEWVAMPSSRRFSQPRGQTPISLSPALANMFFLAPPGKSMRIYMSPMTPICYCQKFIATFSLKPFAIFVIGWNVWDAIFQNRKKMNLQKVQNFNLLGGKFMLMVQYLRVNMVYPLFKRRQIAKLSFQCREFGVLTNNDKIIMNEQYLGAYFLCWVILLDGKSTGHEQNLADFKPKMSQN